MSYKKPLLVPSPSLHVKVIHAVVPQDVLQDCWVSALEKFRSITLPLLTESGSAEEKVSKFTDGFQELKRMKYDVDADEVFTGKEVSKNTRLLHLFSVIQTTKRSLKTILSQSLRVSLCVYIVCCS